MQKPLIVHAMSPERAARAAAARAGKNRAKGQGHPTTADIDYSQREMEFMFAIEEYKKATGHKFPTWSEALRVIDSLGYVKQQAWPVLQTAPGA